MFYVIAILWVLSGYAGVYLIDASYIRQFGHRSYTPLLLEVLAITVAGPSWLLFGIWFYLTGNYREN